MQFQTEFAQPDIVQTFFHHVQRGALFGDEQHPAVIFQRVGDDVRNRLAFARAGRSVQYEAFARARKRDRRKLRTVRRQRNQRIRGVGFVLFFGFGVLRAACAMGNQRGNQLVFGKFVDARADVVPHQIPLERERRHVRVFRNAPAFHARRFGENDVDQFGNFMPRNVAAQSAHIDIKRLFQIFEQRGVHEILFFRIFQRKIFVAFRAADFRRAQNQRRVPHLIIFLAGIAQKAHGKIQNFHARFFAGFAVAPKQPRRAFRKQFVVRLHPRDAAAVFEGKQFLLRIARFAAEFFRFRRPAFQTKAFFIRKRRV